MKAYRKNPDPTKAKRDELLIILYGQRDCAERVAANVLAAHDPNRFGDISREWAICPNEDAMSLGQEMPGKFAEWLLSPAGYIVETDATGKEIEPRHSMWLTYKRFCAFRVARKSDALGKSNRAKGSIKPLAKSTLRHKKRQYRNVRHTAAFVDRDGHPEVIAPITGCNLERLCILWREDFPKEVKELRDAMTV